MDPVQTPPQAQPTPSDNDNDNRGYKDRRPVTLLAALGIIAVSSGAVAGLIYDLVVNQNQQSLTQLGTLATLGLGGLLALSGTKKGE